MFNFIPTSADNVAQQTALAEEALRSKPDAVVFTPTDAKALVPVVAKFTAPESRSSTSTTVSPAAMSPPMSAATIAAIARATARVLLKAMNGTGTVVILEGPPKLRLEHGCACAASTRRSRNSRT